MKLPIYQVDAFTENLFKGNPAAVCPLEKWPGDDIMQNIAKENNLSETAFFVQTGSGKYHLRWFTPEFEIDLCGHATLASAHVLFNHLQFPHEEIVFETQSGELKVKREDKFLQMDFPSWMPKQIESPEELVLGLHTIPLEVWKSRDILALFENEEAIKQLTPDFHILSKLEVVGIIATAKGNKVDFVSRFFAPRAGVNEDPVTGSAHSTLVPFWSEKLGKTSFHARQLSERGGELHCEIKDNRVFIRGMAVTFMEGLITLPSGL